LTSEEEGQQGQERWREKEKVGLMIHWRTRVYEAKVKGEKANIGRE